MRWIRGLAVLAALGLGGWLGVQRLMAPVVTDFDDDIAQFHHGSIGNDGATGIPFAIWAVLPEVFPDLMPGPGGFAAFGFLDGAQPDLPIGFSRNRVGVDRVAVNCALCHTARVRAAPGAAPALVVGGAANLVDLQAFLRFLSAAAADPRFTPGHLVPAMARRGDIGWLERQLHRLVLVRRTREEFAQMEARFAWAAAYPDWGPGRIEAFTPVLVDLLGLPPGAHLGIANSQPLWRLGDRRALHWDGLNSDPAEVVLASFVSNGAVAAEFSEARYRRMVGFLSALEPPASPHRPDPQAVARGADAFAAHCADCHGAGGARTGTVIPLAEVGTSPDRLAVWTAAARDAFLAHDEGRDWSFARFRTTDGYVAGRLEGVWSTAPYLHNGSVPTLADLLRPPADRPVAFLRGLDVLDAAAGGFVAPACDPDNPPPRSAGFCLDTRARGNGNGGHLWGTELPEPVRADLVAYMLTL